MQRDSDEDAWRAIVENYGERVQLDDEPLAAPPVEARPDTSAESLTEPSADAPPDSPAVPPATQRLEKYFAALPEPADPVEDPEDALEERYVPPPPPPLPKLPPDRLLAWLGLFGSPSVLLVCLVIGVHLPPWLGYLLVGSFVGGFLYLVAKMPRGDDIDPYDDGARI